MLDPIRNTLGLALGNLRRNKLRTGLSLLGIMIGVFAVTIIVSLGFGLKSYILGMVEQFGKDYITINAKVPGISHQGSITSQFTSADVASITYEDAEKLAEIPHVTEVIAFDTGQTFVSHRDKDYRSMIFGTTANYMAFDLQAKMAQGRFFTEREEKEMTPVLVLGSKVAEKLFGDQDPIGKKVRLKTLQLEVIGVLAPRGAMGPMDFDTIVMMPLKLMQKRISGSNYIVEIDLMVSETKYIDAVASDAERILRRRHDITDPDKDDFMMMTYTEVIATIDTVTSAITILLGLLAAISLLVGGIGIMNVMLISVTERIREVGLRKALGARNSTIWAQFLAEAVVLTTVGGILGGLAATGITFAVIAYARYAGFDVQYIVSLSSFLGGLTVAIVVGVIFGAWPAKKAAELDVVTALRYE